MSGAIGGSIASTAFSQGSENMWQAFPNIMEIKSFRYQDKANKNKYQWMINDLRKAGINPLLGLGGASAQAAPYSSSSGSHSGQNLGNSMQAAAQINLQKEQLRLERARTISDIQVNNQRRYEISNSADRIAAERDKARQEEALLKQQVDANLSSAQQKHLTTDLLLKQYEIYKAKAQKGIYKGKKGNVMGYLEWLKTTLSPFVK